jgi:hypothetical protein
MRRWTERDIIDRLQDGWVLEGDIESDEPFVFIYPLTYAPAVLPFPTVPSALVRSLAEAGEIVSMPGRIARYWKLSA